MSKWFVTIDWLRDNWIALSINNSRCDFENHVKKITTTCLKHDRRLSTKKHHDDDSRRYTSDHNLKRKFYYDVNKFFVNKKLCELCKSYSFFFSSIESFAHDANQLHYNLKLCENANSLQRLRKLCDDANRFFFLQLEVLIISSINDIVKSISSTISSLTRELSINFCNFICRLCLLKALR